MTADTVAAATRPEYVLGHRDDELARLDHQAATLAQATRTILTLGGVASGMRVLDLGTGTGEVAILAGDLVGPAGQVLGVDRSRTAIDYAAAKVADRGIGNVRFAVSDLGDVPADERFDAIIGRLVLAYQPSPVDTLRELVRDHLRPGGRLVTMEYDLLSFRSIPMTPLVHRYWEIVNAAFDAVGTPQTLGPRLQELLPQAGVQDVDSLGIQIYFAPEDPAGPALLTAVVNSLLPAIERHGLAAATDIGIDTLHRRLADDLIAHDAVIAAPILVGSWGHV